MTGIVQFRGATWRPEAGMYSDGAYARRMQRNDNDADNRVLAAAKAWSGVPSGRSVDGDRVHAIARRSVAEMAHPNRMLAIDAPAIERLRQALDGLHWVDITSVPVLINTPSDALKAVEAQAGLRCLGDNARQWRGNDLARNPYAGLELLVEETKAHAMLDQAALLYGIARLARKGVAASPPHADADAALLALRFDFARALSEEDIKKKLFSEKLGDRKYDHLVAAYARIGMVGPEVLAKLKSETEIFHNGRTLPGVSGKNAEELAQSRYVRLFLNDYWGLYSIGDHASRVVADWLDEQKLSTGFAFGTGRHAIASVMRAVTGMQFAESEQAELLAGFSSLALEESALGGIPPSIRQAARHLAEARGLAAVADDAPAAEVKAEIDTLMDSLRAELGPFPLQFTEQVAALDILADASGLDQATLRKRKVGEEQGVRRVVVSVRAGGFHVSDPEPAPSILEQFLQRASIRHDHSAYEETRAMDQRSIPDFFCVGADGLRIGLNASAEMDKARTRYNVSLRSHPWTIAKAKDELRLAGQALTDEALQQRIVAIAHQYHTPLSEEQAAARKREVLSAIPGIGVLVGIAYGIEDLVRDGDPSALLYALPVMSSIATVVSGLRDIAMGDHDEGTRKLIRLVPVVGDLNEARHYAADGNVEMAVLMVANAVVTVATAIKRRFLPGMARGAIATRLAGLPPGMLHGVRAPGPGTHAAASRVTKSTSRSSRVRPFKNRVAPYQIPVNGEPPRRATAPTHSLRLGSHITAVELPEDVSRPDAEFIRRSSTCGPDQGYVEIDGRHHAAYRMHDVWHVERKDAAAGVRILIPLTRDGQAWRLKTGHAELVGAAGLERLFENDHAPADIVPKLSEDRSSTRTPVSVRSRESSGERGNTSSSPEKLNDLLRAAASENFTVPQAQRLVGKHPLSRFTDADKGFVYRGFTFRGDTRPYAEIFSEGFRLRNEVDDVRDVNGFRGGFGGAPDARDRDGRGISTSPYYNQDNAGAYYYGGHRGGYTYLVDGRSLEGYDLYRNWQYVLDGYGARRGSVSPRPWEVNYADRIPGDRIVGAFDRDGRYFPNPNYQTTANASGA